MGRMPWLLVFGVAAACGTGTANVEVISRESVGGSTTAPSIAAGTTTSVAPTSTAITTSTTSTTTTTVAPTTTRVPALAHPDDVGQPWGDTVAGLLTFRGNPSHTYHGTGPIPGRPEVLWRYPDSAMCGLSREYGETREWCGTGWVGQPAVFERDGRTWVVFGAYDYRFHFLDAMTGEPILPPFPTGDIAKGTVTVDPDGYPLVYGGSRDNLLRVLAIDRDVATELWALDSTVPELQPHLWNNDWDAAPLIIGDHLVTGGENSRFHVVRLNRSYGPDGLVQVAPELVFTAPAWDDELLANLPDDRVSVENAVTMVGDIAYFTSSGGLVQGWDLSSLRTGEGEITRTFRFWSGDDTDATIVADASGALYVGQEWDRRNERGQEIGQLLKIDPSRPDDPVVWSIDDQIGDKSGTWSTPALWRDLVIWPTYTGPLYGIDRATGEIRWTILLPYDVMSSPVVVDDVLMQADATGVIHAWDLTAEGTPVEMWSTQLPANIESTPALWNGRLYVGTRDGYFYAVGDR
jgi:outer membrane protein assembly factor BamB